MAETELEAEVRTGLFYSGGNPRDHIGVFLNGRLMAHGEQMDYVWGRDGFPKFDFQIKAVDVLMLIDMSKPATASGMAIQAGRTCMQVSYNRVGGLWIDSSRPVVESILDRVKGIKRRSIIQEENSGSFQRSIVVCTIDGSRSVEEMYSELEELFKRVGVKDGWINGTTTALLRREGEEGDLDETMWRLGKRWGE
jgi:hypothetical protein